MIDRLRKLSDLLNRRERRNALLLFGMMLVAGLVEVGGVASILPFMAVLSKPEIVQTSRYLGAVYRALGFADTSSFLTFLAAVTFVVMVGRIAFTALTDYATVRYTQMRAFAFSVELLECYLQRPYGWFLNRHTADMSKAVLSEVDEVIKSSLICTLNLISQSVVAAFLIAVVTIVKPLVAVSAAVLIGVCYSAIYLSCRRYLDRLGHARFDGNRRRFKIAQEALAGIKEVKIAGLEHAYLRRFSNVAYRYARCKSVYPVVSQAPRYLLEALVIGGILTIVLVLLNSAEGDLSRVLPLLALYALAGLRLLPAVQNIYASLASLRFGGAALDALHADLVATRAPVTAGAIGSGQTLPLRQSIELHDISFAYPKAKCPTLVNISLKIAARTTVGFVGRTGAGKSTLVDIILGLLTPQQGEVTVDGACIAANNVRDWQRAIGYVPQHIFLVDDTVAANIAFGDSPDKIDMRAVEQAARMAELHEFIMDELPRDYQTEIGERGVRLSGGQRQRIGIARALYRDPDVLVLDEATSALDTITEGAIMDAIHNLAHRKTILIIAHRLTTLQACDQVFMLEKGSLRAHGTYENLLDMTRGFRQMAS